MHARRHAKSDRPGLRGGRACGLSGDGARHRRRGRGGNRDLVLYPTRLSQELLNLLGSEIESSNTGRADLGLQLHAKGLMNLSKERSQYTLEEIRQVVTDSEIKA